jgi:ribosome maturation factor RimP
VSAALDPQLADDLAALAAAHGCELLHAEFVQRTLRLVLDRPEGVTLADCERVSREASALLDASGFGGARYLLEVSSPGLDRPLYRPEDYDRFAGRLGRVTFRPPDAARKRTVVGRLEGRSPDGHEVLVHVDDETMRIPLAWVAAARLEIEL